MFARTRTWETIYDKIKPSPVLEEAKELAQKHHEWLRKVAKVYGYLFKGQTKEEHAFYVIPLVHFSSRIRNMMLRSSYFDYLEQGLTDYKERGA